MRWPFDSKAGVFHVFQTAAEVCVDSSQSGHKIKCHLKLPRRTLVESRTTTLLSCAKNPKRDSNLDLNVRAEVRVFGSIRVKSIGDRKRILDKKFSQDF